MDNVMIDLETLSTKSNAVVISIGAVYFGDDKLGDTFYAILDSTDQQEVGRHISQDTLKWWAQQSEQARAVFDKPATPTAKVLADFADYLGDKNLQIWGNGADFDNIIWGSLYEDFSIKKPWSYGNNRCYRTIKNILVSPTGLPPRRGTHHNALDDAIHQAEWAMLLLKGQLK